MLNEDYSDMLRILIDHEVRFLIVGAYALGAHGYPRATGDFDIWVESSEENARRVLDALKVFGAPVGNLPQKTFAEPGIVYQIGVAPRRIDVLTSIDGVAFAPAYERRMVLELEQMALPFISREDLIANKRASGRRKDQWDADVLEGVAD